MPNVKPKIVKQGNQMGKMISDLMQMHEQNVQVGHFASQGLHSKAGIPYVTMMERHHTGYEWNRGSSVLTVPPRPVLDILGFKIRNLKVPKIRLLMRLWGKFNFTPASSKMLLTEIGKIIGKMEKDIFGDPSVLEPNAAVTVSIKGADTPLVDTHELKDKVAYKTSLEGVVKEIG